MKNKRIKLLFIVILIIVTSCSEIKEKLSLKKSITPARKAEAVSTKYYEVDEKANYRNKQDTGKKKDTGGLQTPFFNNFYFTKERLLEYKVNLSYNCDNLLESRKKLLEIITKYGFIKNSSSYKNDSYTYMSTEIFVLSHDLYEVLIKLEKLGILKSENINAADHTENMYLNNIRVNREKIRINRKNRSISKVSAGLRSWKDIDASLEKSENQMDNAKFEQWKIEDRVKWAKIYIHLQGEPTPGKIEIPNYKKALIGLTNMLLKILYGIIYASPFIIIFIIILLKRDHIISFFKGIKKKKK